MKLPLPTYRHPIHASQLVEAVSMFVEKLAEAVKTLTAEPNMRFDSHNQMIQLIMYHAGLFMCEESFKDVEQYLGDGAGVILRDFGHE
jgi:hypothetical protein